MYFIISAAMKFVWKAIRRPKFAPQDAETGYFIDIREFSKAEIKRQMTDINDATLRRRRDITQKHREEMGLCTLQRLKT